MVTMKKIQRVGSIVCMDCYAEGKEDGFFYLEIDVNSFNIVKNSLNEMNAYVFHAVQNVRKYVLQGEELPEQMISVWY